MIVITVLYELHYHMITLGKVSSLAKKMLDSA